MFRLIVPSFIKNAKCIFSHAPIQQLTLKNLTYAESRAWKSELQKNTSISTKKDQKVAHRPSTELNSVSNEELKIVTVKGLPTGWGEKEITSYFATDKHMIQKVSMIKDRLGNTSGKALFTFGSKEDAEKFITKWDRNMIDTPDIAQVIAVSLFTLNTRSNVAKARSDMRSVYVYNLSFECTNDDLYNFAGEYGEVDNIQVPLTANSKNKGFGFITFTTVDAAEKFMEYANDTDFQGRPIKIQKSSSRYEGKSLKKGRFSDFVFSKNQGAEDTIKGENLKENMKLYKELTYGNESGKKAIEGSKTAKQ